MDSNHQAVGLSALHEHHWQGGGLLDPWCFSPHKFFCGEDTIHKVAFIEKHALEPAAGVEPAPFRLQGECSAIKLRWLEFNGGL